MGCFTVIHEYIRVLVLIERLSDAFHLSLKSFELFIAFNCVTKKFNHFHSFLSMMINNNIILNIQLFFIILTNSALELFLVASDGSRTLT